MGERSGAVTMHGKPLTLVGKEIKVGDKAPDAVLVGKDMSEVRLSSFRGKPVILSSALSLDTGVCDVETRRFNKEAAGIPGVALVTITMDLPFAQSRWCGAAGVDKIVLLSDHRDASFGMNYGLLIKETRLDARCVLVLDSQGVVRYKQLVKEMSQEPDYDACLAAVRKLTS